MEPNLNVPRSKSTRLILTIIAILAIVGIEVAQHYGIPIDDQILLYIEGALVVLIGADTLRPLGVRGVKVSVGPSEVSEGTRTPPTLLTLVLAIGLLATGSMMTGCNKYVLNDAALYQTQLSWLDARRVEAQQALTAAAIEARDEGDLAQCRTYADAALVQKHGVAYRLQMMGYLVDLNDDPGEAQAIPEADAICIPTPTP